MKVTVKIAKAELSTLFYSPIAWFLFIVFIFQCGLTYTNVLQNFLTTQYLGGSYLKYIRYLTNTIFAPPFGLFSTVVQKVYLYIPLLTMGLISREISSGTIKLLYSSPVKISQIVLGKFLAMMIYNFLLILILACFVMAGQFSIYSADLGLMISGLLGVYLLLCAYSAIGLFMSSLTSYQIVAALATLVVFAVLEYIGTLWQNIDFVRDLTYFLSISGRAGHILTGIISTKDVLYFALIVYMFLGFSIIKLRTERKSQSGIILTGKYVFVFFSALAIGYISSQPALIGYYDANAGKELTLTPNSQKIVKDIGNDLLEITSYDNLLDNLYWTGEPEQRNTFLRRWEPYLRFKPNIKFKYVYYYDMPGESQRLFQNNPGMSLKQIAEKRAKTINVDLKDFRTPEEIKKIIDLKPENNRYVMHLSYKGRTTFLRIFDDQMQFPSETEIDAALKRLTVRLPKIAFLEGEYERSKDKSGDREYGVLTSQATFRYALVNQGFDVETVSLKDKEIPTDIAALVIADPKTSFDPAVLEKIQKYIADGGNLLIAGEPGKQAVLAPIIGPMGIQLMDGTLVQKSKDNTPNMVVPLFTSAITGISQKLERRLKDSIGISMPGAAGLSYATDGTYAIKPLLMTDERVSWNKKGKLVIDSADVVFSPTEGDEKQSVPTVVALTRKVNGKEQRIIVSGDADFLSNSELSRYNTANFEFATDLFGWFTYGQFPIDTSRPESPDKRLTLTDVGMTAQKYIFLGIFPGLILVLGAVVLIRRKRK